MLLSILNKVDAAVAAEVQRGLVEIPYDHTLEAKTEGREAKTSSKFAHHTAGKLMSSQFLAVNQNLTAVPALDMIRIRARDAEATSYALVVDERGQARGRRDRGLSTRQSSSAAELTQVTSSR